MVKSSNPNAPQILWKTYRENGELKAIFQYIDRNNEKDKVKVPKWLVGLSFFGCIAILIALIAALVVVYFAQRPALYTENCEKRSCFKGLNLKCINKTCLCESDHFYTKKCIPKKNYMEKCHLTSYCVDNANMVCRDGVCKCYDTKYWNGTSCVNKGTLGDSCTNDDQCLTLSLLYCDQNTQKCACSTKRFWDMYGSACVLKRTYKEYCKNDLQCREWLYLTCKNNLCQCNTSQFWDTQLLLCRNKFNENETCTNTNQCYEPMNCTSNGICQCGAKEYHDPSTLSCIPQKTYGQSCSITYNCRVDKYLECRNGICLCISNYPTWSTERDMCILMSTYSQNCLYQSDCDYTKSLICNTGSNCTCPLQLTNGKCDCVRQISNEYYWNGASCVSALIYGQPCSNSSTSYMCQTITQGTICSGATCKCSSLQYYRILTSQCENQLLYDDFCPQNNECRIDLGLSCQTGTCQCNNTAQFWNGTRCVNYYTYNSETCGNDTECKGILICRSSSSGSSCTCPSNVPVSKCDCPVRVSGGEYYWNGANCVLSLSYGQSCSSASTSYMCQTLTQGTVCSGTTSFTCKCPTLQYYKVSTSKCENQLLNNDSCPQGNECRTDLGLSCQGGKCKCNTATQFWNNSLCINYYTYDLETCSDDNQCKGILVCKTSGSSCNCPTNVPNNKCDCPIPVAGFEYFWNGTGCVLAASYGESCTAGADYTCRKIQEKTYCNSSGLCDCLNSGWNSTIEECVPCATNWNYYKGSCFRISSVNFLGKTAALAAVQTGCYSHSGSKLGQISDSEVSSSFFQTLATDASIDKYYFDAFFVSTNVYKSLDGTLTYNSASWSKNGGNCCAVFKDNKFEDDVNNHAHRYLCQYDF